MIMTAKLPFKELRIKAGFKQARLAREAGISASTLYRIENGGIVTREMVQSVLNVINNKLQSSYTIADIEGLNISEH
jgi:DNA-binding XRE family transcriptional regulator